MLVPDHYDKDSAERSRPSHDEVMDLIGVDPETSLTFLVAIPVLTQERQLGGWAYVVKDCALNRYLVVPENGRWQLADVDDLNQLTRLYSSAAQAAVKAMIEMKEGTLLDIRRATTLG